MAPRQRLFIAQSVHVCETQWFAPGAAYYYPKSDEDSTPIRSGRHFSIKVTLFPASDEEAAYQMASKDAENDSDGNFDGPGQRNLFYALGLHELEEYPNAEEFSTDLLRRGVWITSIVPGEVDSAGVPRVREKDELEVFRVKRPRTDKPATT